MPRTTIDVSRAGVDDVDVLADLWAEARDEVTAAGRQSGFTSADQMRARLADALTGQDLHILIARWDGRAAGYVAVRTGSLNPLLDGPALQIEHLFVTPGLRRHGVARALMVAVAGMAERHGADQVVSNVPSATRETHRFLARLGFAPLAVRRVVATPALRRRLSGGTRRGALDDLLSRRRSLRARSLGPQEPAMDGADDALVESEVMAEEALADAVDAAMADVVEEVAAVPPTLELPLLRDPPA